MTAWRNRTAATAAALAFVIGTTAVPALHLAFHALPHDHHGGGIHYHDHHQHETDHDPDRDHGDGSAAHFAAALADAPATSIDLTPAGMAERGSVARRRDRFRPAAEPSVLRFRGPPVAR